MSSGWEKVTLIFRVEKNTIILINTNNPSGNTMLWNIDHPKFFKKVHKLRLTRYDVFDCEWWKLAFTYNQRYLISKFEVELKYEHKTLQTWFSRGQDTVASNGTSKRRKCCVFKDKFSMVWSVLLAFTSGNFGNMADNVRLLSHFGTVRPLAYTEF